jgi:hypothetical protein
MYNYKVWSWVKCKDVFGLIHYVRIQILGTGVNILEGDKTW